MFKAVVTRRIQFHFYPLSLGVTPWRPEDESLEPTARKWRLSEESEWTLEIKAQIHKNLCLKTRRNDSTFKHYNKDWSRTICRVCCSRCWVIKHLKTLSAVQLYMLRWVTFQNFLRLLDSTRRRNNHLSQAFLTLYGSDIASKVWMSCTYFNITHL